MILPFRTILPKLPINCQNLLIISPKIDGKRMLCYNIGILEGNEMEEEIRKAKEYMNLTDEERRKVDIEYLKKREEQQKYEKASKVKNIVSYKDQYEAQLKKEQDKLDRIFSAYEDGTYSKEDFAERKKNVENKKASQNRKKQR